MENPNDNAEVKELIVTLDRTGLQKEKGAVQSLVNYLEDMEKTLTEMLTEMQSMRQEINLIHNNSLKSKCILLVRKTDEKIKQGLSFVAKAKDNFLKSVSNALKAFREHGKDALRKAVQAMKIPATLDKLAGVFGKFSKDLSHDSEQLKAMQSELNGAKGHLRNLGRLIVGKAAKETEKAKADRGILSRFGKFAEKAGNGFASLEKKAMDAADRLRVTGVKESVKAELDELKGFSGGEKRRTEHPLDR